MSFPEMFWFVIIGSFVFIALGEFILPIGILFGFVIPIVATIAATIAYGAIGLMLLTPVVVLGVSLYLSNKMSKGPSSTL